MKKETLTAYTNSNGTIRYYNEYGDLHNPNGPALIWPDGEKEYWINDKELTEADFKAWQAQQTAK